MLLKGEMPVYTQSEEKISAYSHFIGLAFAVIGTVAMLAKAAETANAALIVSIFVYGASLIALFALSASYHSTSDPAKRRKMQKCDHSSISILIAGAGTALLGGGVGTTAAFILLGFVWLFAANAFVFNIINVRKYRAVTMASYIAAGWTPMILIIPIYQALGTIGFSLFIAGGAIYMLGLTFYAIHKTYLHAIWHFFVLLASVLHYAAFFMLLV